MTAQREDSFKPAWTRDRLDSEDPPEIEAAYFDPDLQAWVLSRHADLLTAFHTTSLIPGRRDLEHLSVDEEESARLTMREEVRAALCPAHLRAWREKLTMHADELCRRLPVAEPVDLIAAYARPLCLYFAAMVTGVAQQDAENLEGLAQIVSMATAAPEDLALRDPAKSANEKLRTYFSSGPEPLRDSGFVGLSQTLLRMIGAAWYALIRFADQWHLLHGSPHLIDQAIEELLRYASVIRILVRTATEDFDLDGASIRRGDQVLLRVFAANHDPAHFGESEKLDCERHDPGHFAFGAGGHACVAANLNRSAAIIMTRSLVARFPEVRVARPVEWQGGSVLRSPASLWVEFGQIG